METDTLWALLDERQWEGSFMTPDKRTAVASIRALEQCRAELTALEADSATKDKALRSIIVPDGSKEDMKTWCGEDAVLLDIPAEEVIQQLCEELGRVRTEAQAALSPPTGKVLVGREGLMGVLDRNFKEAGIEITVRRYNTILTDLGFSLLKD